MPILLSHNCLPAVFPTRSFPYLLWAKSLLRQCLTQFQSPFIFWESSNLCLCSNICCFLDYTTCCTFWSFPHLFSPLGILYLSERHCLQLRFSGQKPVICVFISSFHMYSEFLHFNLFLLCSLFYIPLYHLSSSQHDIYQNCCRL